jgi:hypothetical protein
VRLVSLLFAYADPPYPGLAKKYYQHEATYAGEVDHAKLIASLGAGGYSGWALSTSVKALRDVLPLCPPEARVCAWVKPIGASSRTFGLHNTWEPLIVVCGRKLRPGRRDWLSAQPARGAGELPGRKPLAFCAFLFDCLGMLPGDRLDDLFPGTGMVGRAWEAASQEYSDDGPASAVQNNGCRSGCGRFGGVAESAENACAKEGSRTPTGITPQEPESVASVTIQPKTSVSAEAARQESAADRAAMTDCGCNSQKGM